MKQLRMAAAPLALAWARARARPGRGLLVVAGTAIALAGFGAVIGAGSATAELSTRRAVEQLGPDRGAFTIGWFGVPPADGGYDAIDRRATPALARLSGAGPARSLIFPQLNLGGGAVDLAALDDPGRYLRLVSGRLPRRCTPERCEVVEVGGHRAADEIAQPGIRLVRVGQAQSRAPLPLPGRAAETGHAARAPFLVAGSVAQLSGLPAFSALYRAYAWTAAIEPGATHVWDIDRLLAREGDVQSSLLFAGSNFRVSGPDAQLIAARDRARVSGHRLLLVGGGAAALVLAFVVLAAGSLRRDLDAEWRRLDRRGARRWQRLTLALAEGGWMTAGGALLGFAAACLIVWAIADRAGLDAAAVLGHSLLSGRGLALMAAAWLAALALLVLAERAPLRELRMGPVTLADLLAAAALLAALLAAARGSADSSDLSRSDPLLPLLPPLLCLAGGVVAARLVPPLARLAERALRRRSPRLRLAALWLARGGGQAAVTVGFLAVSIGLALFAASYAATLERGVRDQAAFAVPAAFSVREGSQLRQPLDVAPLSRYRDLSGGGWAAPVLRRSGTVPLIGLSPVPVDVLGVPSADLARLRPWRADYGRLAVTPPVAVAGAQLPAGQTTITVTASAKGVPVALGGLVRDSDGGYERVEFGDVPRRPTELTGTLEQPGGMLVAFTVGLSAAGSKTATHQAGEGGGATALPGTLTLRGPAASDGWVAAAARSAPAAGGVRLVYRLGAGDVALLRAPQPNDGRPLPVIASRDIARAAGPRGIVQIRVAGEATVTAHIVSVADRFPTLAAPFVVADESALAEALVAQGAGATAEPGEVWIGGGDPAAAAAALRRPPFDALAVDDRAAVERRLREDPLAHGITLTLWAASALALVLAVAGMALAIAGSLRDERGELHDLEVQGVAPATLRSQLRLRALALALTGALAGVVLGIALAASTIGLVALAAGATTPQPPLVREADWAAVAALAAAFVIAAAAVVALLTASAFREPTPRRSAGAAP